MKTQIKTVLSKKFYHLAIAALGLGLLVPVRGWAAEQKTDPMPAWNPNILCGLASPGLKSSVHQYYDIPAWNCDGSLLLILGIENNGKTKKQPFLVTELGTEHRRPLLSAKQAADTKKKHAFQWDVADPSVMYYLTFDSAKKLTTVHKLNVRTNADEEIASAVGELGLAVPHPDGNHLLLIPRLGGTEGLNLVSLRERKATPIRLGISIHRVRFTKNPDLSVFCNTQTEKETREADRISYLLDITSGERHALVKGQAGHPDWSPDGMRLSFFKDDGLWVVDRQGKQLQLIPRLGGHQSWSSDGKYIVFDGGSYYGKDENGKKKKFQKYISIVELASEKVTPLVPHHSKMTSNQDTHPHPVFSPDGTKVAFNSNHEGKDPPQVHIVVARKPASVQNLIATPAGNSCRLSWSPPQARETKRFLIYHLLQDGQWARFAEADRTQNSATVPAAADVKGYGVVVEEFSGLQSEMCQTLVK